MISKSVLSKDFPLIIDFQISFFGIVYQPIFDKLFLRILYFKKVFLK